MQAIHYFPGGNTAEGCVRQVKSDAKGHPKS